MKTLKLTFGALAAGLVLASGCGREHIWINRDVTGDGIPDVLFTKGKNNEICRLEVGKIDGTTENFKSYNFNDVQYFKDKQDNAYFFNGKNFQYAPAWKKIGFSPQTNRLKYISEEAQ